MKTVLMRGFRFLRRQHARRRGKEMARIVLARAAALRSTEHMPSPMEAEVTLGRC